MSPMLSTTEIEEIWKEGKTILMSKTVLCEHIILHQIQESFLEMIV